MRGSKRERKMERGKRRKKDEGKEEERGKR